MSIRFQCGSCSQPIEVDDEWASKPVACPYCRKTVTAPMESTLGDPAAFQTAAPVTMGTTAAPPFLPTVDAFVPAPSRNKLAVVSLVLAVTAVALFIACGLVSAKHSAQFEKLNAASAGAGNFAERVKMTNELLEDDPEAMRWMIPVAMLAFGWSVTNIAAIVCGIIAARRRERRGIAIAALATSFLPVLLFL